MLISVKDGIKLVGISIICFCAAFVCTAFFSFAIDVRTIEELVTVATQALYDAQVATAKFVCGITGGFLSVVAAATLVFYIRLYVSANMKTLGIFKAIGYSDFSIASRFWVFAASVLLGCGLGYGIGCAAAPAIYSAMTIEGLPTVVVKLHASVPIAVVVAPTVVFAAIAVLFARVALRRNACAMLRESVSPKSNKKTNVKSSKNAEKRKDVPFLREMAFKTVGDKKAITVFVAFSAFCFSAMVQMGVSMENLVDASMGTVILVIGVVLAVTTLFMALTALVNGNAKSIAVMKVSGYSLKECAAAVFLGFVPFLLVGFIVGTVYQFGLLKIMVNIVFKDVEEVPSYSFDVPALFITLGAFVAFCAAVGAYYVYRLKNISVKKIMSE